jgi:hypothetical protein
MLEAPVVATKYSPTSPTQTQPSIVHQTHLCIIQKMEAENKPLDTGPTTFFFLLYPLQPTVATKKFQPPGQDLPEFTILTNCESDLVSKGKLGNKQQVRELP